MFDSPNFNLQFMMPLYESDLHHYIGSGIDEKEAQTFAGCLIDAVHYLHARSVIHRDIKPGNILIQRKPMVAVLSDFGAARKLLAYVEGSGNEGLRHPTILDRCRLEKTPEVDAL